MKIRGPGHARTEGRRYLTLPLPQLTPPDPAANGGCRVERMDRDDEQLLRRQILLAVLYPLVESIGSNRSLVRVSRPVWVRRRRASW